MLLCRHIAANCNPQTNSLLFLDPQHLVYAFSNQLAIYHLPTNRVLLTLTDNLHEHRRVNCIIVLTQSTHQLLLAGYDSGYLVCFKRDNEKWSQQWSVKQEGGIQSISAVQNEGTWQVVTNNHNAVLSYYQLVDDQLVLQQNLPFPLNKIVESISLYVKEEKLMMFVGGVDQKIHYYERPFLNPNLQYKFSLSGHENAITKLTITAQPLTNDLLLASASKDGYIRLWRITDDLNAIKFHKNVFNILNDSRVFLEAVLVNHECSVTSLAWVRFGGKLQLASSSLDCTVCLWGSGIEAGAWTVDSRMGQFLGNKNAYFQVLSDPTFSCLAALNYTGAVLLWKWKDDRFVLSECFNGHSNEVRDIEWSTGGDFLVSVSKDQTTRVLAQHHSSKQFHEISRAQIHGYDINAVSLIKVKEGVLDVIACGADEKVVRILEPPACFANYLNTFTKANLHLYFESEEQEKRYLLSRPNEPLLYEAYSEGGTQVLGLMTKNQRIEREKITNYYEEEEGQVEEEVEQVDLKSVKLDYSTPPHEDYLVKHTLWPEMNKLYGHGHQIEALCRSAVSPRMASSCAALNKQAASVIIWNTKDWKVAKILSFHNYTVYDLAFSSKDSYFATVSKDRRLAVYDHQLNLAFSYQAHLRAITCLAFHASEHYLLTGSRDKTIKLHSTVLKKPITELSCKYPVSSVAFCHQNGYEHYFSVGCVNGKILMGRIEGEELKIVSEANSQQSHSSSVNAMKWQGLLLGSCSNDFSVRIFELAP